MTRASIRAAMRSLRAARFSALSATVLVLAACARSAPKAPRSPPRRTLVVDAAAPSPPAPEPVDREAPAPPRREGRPARVGFIRLSQGLFSTVAVEFRDEVDDEDAEENCPRAAVGACQLFACAKSGPFVRRGRLGPNGFPHAGRVTVSAGGKRFQTLHPDPMGGYPFVPTLDADTVRRLHTPIWRRGDRIEISAEGGSVPAFTVSLAAPAAVRVTHPDFGALPRIERGRPLVIRWTDGAPGTHLTLTLTEPDIDGESVFHLSCRFDSTKGSGEIAQELLQEFGGGSANLGFRAGARAEAVAGDWRIEVTATASVASGARDGTGVLFSPR